MTTAQTASAPSGAFAGTPATARLMDGTALARRISQETAAHAAKITERTGTAPCLATVLVGEDPASVTYVRMKQNRCAKAGITSRHVELPASTTTQELVAAITALSEDPEISGILLQHPVPHHIDERAAFEAIAPGKDVDGSPCTPSPRWASDCRASSPAPPAASCDSSPPTTWT